MAIQSIGSTTAQNGAKQTLPGQTVTQDDFLKLLIAQLQNQDPLQPMDNQQFAVQLATFNSLQQLIGINDKLGGLQGNQGLANQYNAASLIGKEVATSGNTISLQPGNPAAVSYHLQANASKVVANVYDSAGNLVRQIDASGQKAGDQTIRWDGKDLTGKALPAGLYNFEINAFDLNGKKVPASGRFQGTVTGVRLDGSEPVLEIGGDLLVPLSAVDSVRSPS
jgi:flagellar basal-body rod modification protein FlgD